MNNLTRYSAKPFSYATNPNGKIRFSGSSSLADGFLDAVEDYVKRQRRSSTKNNKVNLGVFGLIKAIFIFFFSVLSKLFKK